MNLKMSPAWLTLLCLCHGCIFSEGEYAPATDGLDQGADMTRADMHVDPFDLAQQADSAPDADMTIEPVPDMDPDAGDMGDMEQCPSIAQQCQMLGAQCGEQNGFFDQCNPDTPLDCGVCEGPEPLICQNRQCVRECTPRDMETICQDENYHCGERTVMECGQEVQLQCGSCPADPNIVCTASNLCCHKDEQVRMQVRPRLWSEGKCGTVEAEVCGQNQPIVLGMSCNEYAMIQQKEEGDYQCINKQCVCNPETEQELCEKAGRACGPLPTMIDRCGSARSNITCANTCTGIGVKCCMDQGECRGTLTPC
jgi:hypothetical protein